ncbi:unnamed protein product [Rhizophagus irregularis]|nr:unnamed protein product [Rhizophagus irregularis]
MLYTVSFAPSPKAIFRRNTFGTPKFNQLVRRNETVIGAVWFRKLSTNNLNLHVLLATRTMSISLQTYKFDRDSWGMVIKRMLHTIYQIFRAQETAFPYQSKQRSTNILPGSINVVKKTSYSMAIIQETS